MRKVLSTLLSETFVEPQICWISTLLRGQNVKTIANHYYGSILAQQARYLVSHILYVCTVHGGARHSLGLSEVFSDIRLLFSILLLSYDYELTENLFYIYVAFQHLPSSPVLALPSSSFLLLTLTSQLFLLTHIRALFQFILTLPLSSCNRISRL